jgi:AcrR family transcriptional regulator
MAATIGLRERKKLAAMRRIQEVALDLFDERGFEDVSVEEIAQAADVSPSSVYRYFGTKEQIVLHDEFDVAFVDAVEAELASHPPIEAVRRAVAQLMAEFFGRDDELARRKVGYAYDEPALRAATLQVTDGFIPSVADALARASGRHADELDVQVIASVLVWSLVTAARHWHTGGYRTSLSDELDAALDIVHGGLRLD